MSFSLNGGVVKALNFTTAWGITPGSGTATVMGGTFSAAQDFTIAIGGTTISGIAKNPVLHTSDEGKRWEVTLVDDREKLSWEPILAQFNIVQIYSIDPSSFGKSRRRRYLHIFPDDWEDHTVTYTQDPHTGKEVMDFLLSATSNRYAWAYVDHPRLDRIPYNLDFVTGVELGAAIQQVADKCGLIVGLHSSMTLMFTIKGDDSLPVYTGPNVKTYDLGTSLSGNAPFVKIVGDRNLYQDTDIQLVPDWQAGWRAYLFEPDWLDAITATYDLDNTTPAGRAAIASKARTVTVEQFAADSSNDLLLDPGRFGEVTRNSMPAWAYINEIVLKAYAIDPNYSLNGIPLKSLNIYEGLLARVIADGTSGEMEYVSDPSTGSYTFYTDDKAYVIAQGQQMDLSDPAKRDFLDPATIGDLRTLWMPCQKFRIDDRNKVFIFDDAVFVPGAATEGLYTFANTTTDLPVDHPSINLVLPNANARVDPAPIRASICFFAEYYSNDYGSGLKRAAAYVQGLSRHTLLDGGGFTAEILYDTSTPQSADDKAALAAAAHVAKLGIYVSGSMVRLGSGGTTLNGSIDRVSLSLTTEGITETTDFTKERNPDYFDPERELDRAKLDAELFAGQHALRTEVAQLNYLSRILAGMNTKVPTGYRNINDALKLPIGNIDCAPTFYISPTKTEYDAGVPVWVRPDFQDDPKTGVALKGIVIASNLDGGQWMPMATQGVVPVKIKGPVAMNDVVGCNTGDVTDVVSNGARIIGTVLEGYTGTQSVWLPVRLSSTQGLNLHPFSLVVIDATHIRVLYGTVNFAAPDSFQEGDIPPFILNISGTEVGFVFIEATTDDVGNITDCSVSFDTSMPMNSPGDYYQQIGSFSTDDDTHILTAVTAIAGSQAFALCAGSVPEWGLQ